MDDHSPQPGLVSLVGAGPGDRGLITVRGRERLAAAHAVLHDALVSPEVLALVAPTAEVRFAGKRAGGPHTPQEAINRELIQRARAGQRVVRLKGGDPLIFGRAAQEIRALREAGVPYEVVPGVTAGVAAPAYAEIPVTERSCASSVAFVTGSEDPAKPDGAMDWAVVAKWPGTIAFYMTVKNFDAIIGALIDGGMDPETPVAVIENATTPHQRCVTAPLSDIARSAREHGVASPALAIVGRAVEWRQEPSWFEARPLFGVRVVTTRASEGASDFAELLRSLGADVLEAPCVAFEPPEDPRPLSEAVRNLDDWDWLVLTSATAIQRFMAEVRAQGRDSRALAGVRVAVVGSASARALARHGIVADLVPDTYTGRALARALAERGDLRGQRFLLPRSDIAGRALPEALLAGGGEVLEIPAYRTVPVDVGANPRLRALLDSGEEFMIACTSGSGARNFAAALSEQDRRLVARHAVVAAIGPETARVAREECGFRVAVQAREHSLEGLAAAMALHVGASEHGWRA